MDDGEEGGVSASGTVSKVGVLVGVLVLFFLLKEIYLCTLSEISCKVLKETMEKSEKGLHM